MSNQKSENLVLIFNYAQKQFEIQENNTIQSLQQESHQDHLEYQLIFKGTLQDQLKALSQIFYKHKYLQRFCVSKFMGFLQGTEMDKKKLQVLQCLKNIWVNNFGVYKENQHVVIESFKILIEEKPEIMSRFKDQGKLDQNSEAILEQFYLSNFWYTKTIEISQLLSRLNYWEHKYLLKDTVVIVIEMSKKLIHTISFYFAEILVNLLGNQEVQDEIQKALSIIINTQQTNALRIIQSCLYFYGRENQTDFAKQNVLQMICSLNSDQIKDHWVHNLLVGFCFDKLNQFIEKFFIDKQGLKKKILKQKKAKIEKQKNLNAKKLKKSWKMSLQCLVKEQIELESRQLNLIIICLSKILQSNSKLESLKEKFDKYLVGYFKFCRQTQGKLAYRVLQLLYSFLNKDMQGKQTERFMTLLYETIGKSEIFSSKNSESILDLIFNVIQKDFSHNRQRAFIVRMIHSALHCDHRYILSVLILVGKLLEKFPQIVSKEKDQIQNSQETEIIKRNPLYTNILINLDKELSPLKNHYSPIVRKITVLIIQGKYSEIQYNGNPLIDLSSCKILQRFSLQPIKKQNQEKNQQLKRESQITIENYSSSLKEDENCIDLYFKARQQSQLVSKRQKKQQENQDEDQLANELFEKEMEKNQPDDELEFEEEFQENNQSEDFEDEFDDDMQLEEDQQGQQILYHDL